MKWLLVMILAVILVAGCTQQLETIDLAKVDRVSLIIQNHLTENNVSDGKIVYIPLVNKENKIFYGNVKNLTINILLKGLDDLGKYSIILFNRTYENVNYLSINLPDHSEWPEYKKGFVIYYNEIENYEYYFIGIFVKVTLPDGKIIKSSEVDPTTFLVYGYD
jgi:hypothetical protein